MKLQENWKAVLEKYAIIKKIYIECEETDVELKTNLQPLNEFRAALDHIMKMMYAYYDEDAENREEEFESQFTKLNSHLNRSFYDICDMLSINYRNKIVDLLKIYQPETIASVIPKYYPLFKKEIESISHRIAKYRNEKGGNSVEKTDRFEDYSKDVLRLKDIFLEVLDAQESLDEIKRKKKRHTVGAYIISGLVGFAVSLVVALIFL